MPRQQEHHQRTAGDPQHADDIDRLVAVEHALGGRSLLAGVADEVDHLGEHRLIRAAVDADLEVAVEVDGSGHDRITRVARHGHRFAGNRRLVDGRATVSDRAVDGDTIAGAHDRHQARLDLVNRYGALIAVRILDRHRLRAQIHECANRGLRAAERELLEHVAKREEKQQDDAFPEGLHGVRAGGRNQHQQVDIEGAVPQRANRGAQREPAAGKERQGPDRERRAKGEALDDHTDDQQHERRRHKANRNAVRGVCQQRDRMPNPTWRKGSRETLAQRVFPGEPEIRTLKVKSKELGIELLGVVGDLDQLGRAPRGDRNHVRHQHGAALDVGDVDGAQCAVCAEHHDFWCGHASRIRRSHHVPSSTSPRTCHASVIRMVLDLGYLLFRFNR